MNNYTQSIAKAFSQFFKSSKHKPKLLETDNGKEYANKIFNDFLEKDSFERYSSYTDKGAVFAKPFIRNLLRLLKNQYS